MTQNHDLETMPTDKESIEEYRDDLELRIKDLFKWALNEEAEMTRT